MAGRVVVSSLQRQILSALQSRGGAVYAVDPTRELFGYAQVMPLDLAHLSRALAALERRGWVQVSRNWGVMGSGNLRSLKWTDAGRAAATRYLPR